MAILVLGGAGYIGSHTVYELIDAGRDVVVADNLQTGFKAAVHPKARFYQLDIRDRAALDVLFQAEKIDGVIHFAASSQVGESMVGPLKYYDNCGVFGKGEMRLILVYWYTISDRVFIMVSKKQRSVFYTVWDTPLCFYIHICIEVDAVGDSNEHVAVGDAIVLGHAHANAAAVFVLFTA